MDSIVRGKDFAEDWYKSNKTKINTVLDIGCGRGIWAGCLKNNEDNIHWTGLEVHKPYLEKFKKIHNRLYDEIKNEDIRKFNFKPYDLMIAGDILEHLNQQDCENTLQKMYMNCRYAIISLPIDCPPHPAEHGNPHQEHKIDNISEQSAKEMIDQAGFEILTYSIYNCGWLNSPIKISVFICRGMIT